MLNRWVGDAIHLVIARKIVTPNISAPELALGVAAQCVLRVVRFNSPPGKMK